MRPWMKVSEFCIDGNGDEALAGVEIELDLVLWGASSFRAEDEQALVSRTEDAPDSHQDVSELVAAGSIFMSRPILIRAVLNQLGFTGCQQLHLKSRILGKLEDEDCLEHMQMLLRPIRTNLVVIAVCYFLGFGRVHDQLSNGWMMINKLKGLIKVLCCEVESVSIVNRMTGDVVECVVDCMPGAEVNVCIIVRKGSSRCRMRVHDDLGSWVRRNSNVVLNERGVELSFAVN